ncbi:hypothetical protein F4774DRAFT_427259 [Daldinia eschscholtzii]|nr:hypothetical protein F4774DRAFT_427259 [Daldinia eschscholtzii]
MEATASNVDNTGTPSENTPDEAKPSSHVSIGDTSGEDIPNEEIHYEDLPRIESFDEDEVEEYVTKELANTLFAVSKKISELSVQQVEYAETPQSGGFYGRWTVELSRGVCNADDCMNRDGLLTCSDCKAALYCSKVHQITDFEFHRPHCIRVRDALKRLAEEEAKLRAFPGDDDLPANPFETARGRFRFSEAATPYLNQQCRVIKQDAYDFMKWCTVVNREEFDWATFTGEFLSCHDEDILESPDLFIDYPNLLSHIICLTQVKLRLLLDLRMLQREAKKYGKQNADYKTKMGWVREHAVSDILYKRPDIVKRNDWKDLISEINDQVKQLYKRVKDRNEHYWPALDDPCKWEGALPDDDDWTPGGEDEVATLFTMTWDSWKECRPALTAIRIYAISQLDH